MKKLTSLALVAVVASSMMALFTASSALAQSSQSSANLGFYTVTSANSPSNTASLMNTYAYHMEPNKIHVMPSAGTPGALKKAPLIRFSEIVNSDTNLSLWDSTNVTGGMLIYEHGERLCAMFDISSRTPFYAKDISFSLVSGDSSKTLSASGNAGTNMSNGMPLMFSSTLQAEAWDENGQFKAAYHSGQSTDGVKINRLVGSVRVGYYCTTMAQVNGAKNYFKANGPFGLTFMVTRADTGEVFTKTLATNPTAVIGMEVVTILGQRHMGCSYRLERSPRADTDTWSPIREAMKDYDVYWHDLPPMGFYRVAEVYPEIKFKAVSGDPADSYIPSKKEMELLMRASNSKE